MYICTEQSSNVVAFPESRREINRPILRDERDDVASEAALKRLLSVSWLQLQYYGVATKSISSNKFNTIKYHQLPAPYNQLELLQHSKYYMVDLYDDNGLLCGNNIYRIGVDGMPDIFDVSIKRVACVTANEIKINDPFNWIVNPTDAIPHPVYPRHMKHQIGIKIEWR